MCWLIADLENNLTETIRRIKLISEHVQILSINESFQFQIPPFFPTEQRLTSN